jgi:hypothetical protein
MVVCHCVWMVRLDFPFNSAQFDILAWIAFSNRPDELDATNHIRDENIDWEMSGHFPSPDPPHPGTPPPLPTTEPSATRIYHPCPPADFGPGRNLLQAMEGDEYGEQRKQNLFYPFSSRAEWELASWLSQGSLSQKAIDDFLQLDYVSLLGYDRTNELTNRADIQTTSLVHIGKRSP